MKSPWDRKATLVTDKYHFFILPLFLKKYGKISSIRTETILSPKWASLSIDSSAAPCCSSNVPQRQRQLQITTSEYWIRASFYAQNFIHEWRFAFLIVL